MELDVNDPATWPDTLEGLAALALDADPVPEAAAPEATPPATPEATPPATPEATPDPQILTPDGQQYLPFDVLRAERERSAALEAKLAAMSAPPVAAPTPAPPAEPEIPAEVKAKAAKLEADWSPEIAEMYLTSWRAQQQNQQLQASLESVMAQARTAEQARAQQEEAAIQEAIDQSPVMLAWQVDTQSPYYQRAVALHAHLMTQDPEYAKDSWGQRFQRLPGKVEALYGVSPHSAKTGAVKSPSMLDSIPTPAPVAPPPKAPAVPTSLSSIPAAGEAPSVDPADELERMSGPQLQARMIRLAANPAKLQEYLGTFH